MRAGQRASAIALCEPCREHFYLCPQCDHGDKYCGAHCRNAAQLEKHRGVVLRGQDSNAGRALHNTTSDSDATGTENDSA